ncbi:MAG: YDG domain-containing protein [Ruminococcus sp.]|nr:YDG domain-containing protein [Ruminococcus sp.]
MKTNLRKRFLSLTLAVTMILSMLPLSVTSAIAAELKTDETGDYSVSYYGADIVTPKAVTDSNYEGLGFTEANYKSYKGWFIIHNANELYGFAKLVENGNYYAKAMLADDIEINHIDHIQSEDSYNWKPICSTWVVNEMYKGIFDGNGHYISGLTTHTTSNKGNGLFGNLYGATVKNVVIKNSTFSSTSPYMGAIAGYAYDSTILNCSVEDSVTVTSNYDGAVGGIVGFARASTFTDCISSVNIEVCISNETAGYFIGYNSNDKSTLTNCYYVQGTATNIHGVIGAGHNVNATALSSRNDSHNCITIECKETIASCLFDGVSAYSYCLICNELFSGSKEISQASGEHDFTYANCTTPSTCKKCGYLDGEPSYGHHENYGTYTTCIDEETHKIYYTCCNKLVAEEKHYSTSKNKATCTNRALCFDCHNYYGTIDKNNHSSKKLYIEYADNEGHNEFYACCNALKGKVAHTADTPATCLNVAYCNACDKDFGKIDLNNHTSNETYTLVIDDNYHGIYYSCCNTLKEKVKHTSNKNIVTNCSGVSVCDDCGAGFGSNDTTNHAGKIVAIDNNLTNGTHKLQWDCCNAIIKHDSHNYVYTLNESTNEIIATCPDCKAIYSVGLKVQTNATYTGFAINAEKQGSIHGIDEKIIYSTKDGKAPVNVGTYTASITLGDVTINETFTINPKEITIESINSTEKIFDGTNDIQIDKINLSGVVLLEQMNEFNNWTLVYDDVYVDTSEITATVADFVPGIYNEAQISGYKLVGKNADNYILKNVEKVKVENGYSILPYPLTIDIHNQYLYMKPYVSNYEYTVISTLPDGFEVKDVTLFLSEYERHIQLSDCKVVKDDIDYTNCFEINSIDGTYSLLCTGHNIENNGICPNCNNFESPQISLNNEPPNEYESEEFIYEIYNAGQLFWFIEQVNFYNVGARAKLMADINLNPGYTFNEDGTYLLNGKTTDIPPINYTFINENDERSNHFFLDGNGHSVSGIYINTPNEDYAGLFGKTQFDSIIENLHIKNSYICGNNYVGAIAGYSYNNDINKCSVDNTVTVVGNEYVGGITGYALMSHISNSYSRAKLISDNAGGIVSVLEESTLENSYTTYYNLTVDSKGSIINSYYYNEPGNSNGGRPLEAFENGEVAHLLQSAIFDYPIYDKNNNFIGVNTPTIWGQTLGTDKFPVIGGDKVYFGYKDCLSYYPMYDNSPLFDTQPEHNHMIGDIDLDGRLTIRDATNLSKFLASCYDFNECKYTIADANGDGRINIKDTTYIQMKIVGLVE